tara:strand:- start:1139 stop:2218 length:1080 start_codon:yes stop_codon:yes gene_type:complete
MSLLEIAGLSKSFKDRVAVDNVSFSAERGEILCLLGPSGCGKSTLLRMIAGIETPDAGAVFYNGDSLTGVSPQNRGFGLMFQDLALFPHMDVYSNVAFGLKVQRIDKKLEVKRVNEMLDLVDMSGYGSRKIHELSGGELQRVALARSLAPSPKFLMLDEPFTSLDRTLSESIQRQVRSILKSIGVMSLFVTHDSDEAFTMADKLLFMDNGQVVQVGTPEEIYYRPGTEFVARSLGFKNILQGVTQLEGGVLYIKTEIGCLEINAENSCKFADGHRITLLIDEGGVKVNHLLSEEVKSSNYFHGIVISVSFHGTAYEINTSIRNSSFVFRVHVDQVGAPISPGDEISLIINPKFVRVLTQ